MKREFISSSSAKTKKIARSLAPLFLKKRSKKQALIIALEGELGSGKTTFLQGFAKGLGIREKILSPTFVIYKKFHLIAKQLQGAKRLVRASSFKFQEFYHIDCYRIKKPTEILALGFKEIIPDPKNIVAIEWADKIKKIMPKDTIWIQFEFINKKKRRKITIK